MSDYESPTIVSFDEEEFYADVVEALCTGII